MELLDRIFHERSEIEGFQVELEFDKIGRGLIIVTARRLEVAPELPQMVLIALEDVTKQPTDGAVANRCFFRSHD
jgi:hypothetical protein